MKKIFGFIIVLCAFSIAQGQNSKKIKVENFETEIEAKCDAIPGIEIVEFSSKCKEGELQIDYTDRATENPCETNIERSYVVSDACGNKSTFVQNIIVRDTEKPKFISLPPNLTFSNRSEYINSPHVKFPAMTDNCSTEIEKREEIRDDYVNGQMKLYKVYIAKDACGNEIQHTQIITFDID